MPDFSKLLHPHRSLTKPPPVLPIELFPGVIKSYEFGDANTNRTPYARLHVGLTGWPDSIPEDRRYVEDEDGRRPIDISRRQMRTDFYLTPDAIHMLTKFIDDMGIEAEVDAQGNVDLEAAVPKLVGGRVWVQVGQYLRARDNSIQNNCQGVMPMND